MFASLLRSGLRLTPIHKVMLLSDECVCFKVSTPILQRICPITWRDNAFYSVQFRDIELKILGISNAEKVLDVVKDYVENGEVCG